MDKKITIAQIIYGLKCGGAEKLLIPLTSYLKSHGYHVIVIALTCGGPLESDLLKIGIDVRVLQRTGRFRLMDIVVLIKLLKKERITLIHTHLENADICAGIAAKILGITHVSTLHGAIEREGSFEKFKQILKFFLPKKIISVDNFAPEWCAKKFGARKEKFEIIYNGVRSESPPDSITIEQKRKELNIKKESIVLGIIGRLERQKGHIYLFEALRILKKEYPDILLIVAGIGSLKDSFISMVKDFGIEKNVRFLGLRDDIQELLKAIDVVVFSSLQEGISIALLEAMAAAKPIVATRVGGTEEVVFDKKSGLLVQEKNPNALAEAIRILIKDNSLAQRLALSAQAYVKQNFSAEKMLSKIESLYNNAIKR